MAKLDQTDQNQRLLKIMAEDLKLPLLQIARQAELGQPLGGSLEVIESSASQALWLIDAYLLSQKIGQESLPLEPVTVSSVLDDTAHDLYNLAKQYDCNLEVQLSGRYGPVMANRQALRAVLVGLGSSLIGAGGADPGATVILSSYKTRRGIVAGVYSQDQELGQTLLEQSGAAVYMANRLLSGMDSHLRAARHNQLSGLAATLLPSQQLALI